MLKSKNTRNISAYKELHLSNAEYGKSSEGLRNQVALLLRDIAPTSILDFGCGKSRLCEDVADRLDAIPYKYDPAIAEHSTLPIDCPDVILNTDVLEHLDETEVDIVLSDIRRLSSRVYFNISTRPAAAILPNGENAHATVKPRSWWREKIKAHFGKAYDVPCETDEARFVTWRPRMGTRAILYFRHLRSL